MFCLAGGTARDIVIDCSRGELFPCRIGGTLLLELGFERVVLFIP